MLMLIRTEFFVLVDDLDMFRLGAIAAVGRMVPSGNLSFAKITLVGWLSGSWTPKGWDSFGWWPLGLGRESFWLKIPWLVQAGHAPFELYPAFALKLTKSTEDLCQGRRAIRNYSPVGSSAFQVAELLGSPHQRTLSRVSQLVLWCGQRRMESPNPREFACYQRGKVR
jgi:hypothetical protein